MGSKEFIEAPGITWTPGYVEAVAQNAAEGDAFLASLRRTGYSTFTGNRIPFTGSSIGEHMLFVVLENLAQCHGCQDLIPRAGISIPGRTCPSCGAPTVKDQDDNFTLVTQYDGQVYASEKDVPAPKCFVLRMHSANIDGQSP